MRYFIAYIYIIVIVKSLELGLTLLMQNLVSVYNGPKMNRR